LYYFLFVNVGYQTMAVNGSGIWIGIDLKTSNCAASVWDKSKHRAKMIRIGGIGGGMAHTISSNLSNQTC